MKWCDTNLCFVVSVYLTIYWWLHLGGGKKCPKAVWVEAYAHELLDSSWDTPRVGNGSLEVNGSCPNIVHPGIVANKPLDAAAVNAALAQ